MSVDPSEPRWFRRGRTHGVPMLVQYVLLFVVVIAVVAVTKGLGWPLRVVIAIAIGMVLRMLLVAFGRRRTPG